MPIIAPTDRVAWLWIGVARPSEGPLRYAIQSRRLSRADIQHLTIGAGSDARHGYRQDRATASNRRCRRAQNRYDSDFFKQSQARIALCGHMTPPHGDSSTLSTRLPYTAQACRQRRRFPAINNTQIRSVAESVELTISPPIPLKLYTLPYRSNAPFLISDIRALWRSGLSAMQSARMSSSSSSSFSLMISCQTQPITAAVNIKYKYNSICLTVNELTNENWNR